MELSARYGRYDAQPLYRRLAILGLLTAVLAFCGWICETVFFYYLHGEYCDRGLLTLPFCPLYGFAALGIYLTLGTPQTRWWQKLATAPRSVAGKLFARLLSLVLYAACAALLAGVIEYCTALFFDKIMHEHLWSYHRYPANLHGYVCLRFTLLWGVLCLVGMGLIWYPLRQILARVPTVPLVAVAAVVLFAIAADFVFNMLYLSLRGARLTIESLRRLL